MDGSSADRGSEVIERLQLRLDHPKAVIKSDPSWGRDCRDAVDAIQKMGALYWKGKFEQQVKFATGQRFWAEKERDRADKLEAKVRRLEAQLEVAGGR